MTGAPGTTWHERPLLLDCEGDKLLSVLCRPGESTSDLGVVIVVGGPQYRAGSHRQFVQLARSLASAGTPTLRFDARGMGDSTGERRPFTDLTTDITAAVHGLRSECGTVSRIVLCGLCDGASAALLYLDEVRRPDIAGLILMNPWIREGTAASSTTLVKHYYLRRLIDRGLWLGLLRGGVARGALREFLGHVMSAVRPGSQVAAGFGDTTSRAYRERMAAALSAHTGSVLLALSGRDLTAQEFVEHATSDQVWKRCLSRPNVQRLDLPEADHTFSASADRQAVEGASVAFLQGLRQMASGSNKKALCRQTS